MQLGQAKIWTLKTPRKKPNIGSWQGLGFLQLEEWELSSFCTANKLKIRFQIGREYCQNIFAKELISRIFKEIGQRTPKQIKTSNLIKKLVKGLSRHFSSDGSRCGKRASAMLVIREWQTKSTVTSPHARKWPYNPKHFSKAKHFLSAEGSTGLPCATGRHT